MITSIPLYNTIYNFYGSNPWFDNSAPHDQENTCNYAVPQDISTVSWLKKSFPNENANLSEYITEPIGEGDQMVISICSPTKDVNMVRLGVFCIEINIRDLPKVFIEGKPSVNGHYLVASVMGQVVQMSDLCSTLLFEKVGVNAGILLNQISNAFKGLYDLVINKSTSGKSIISPINSYERGNSLSHSTQVFI